MSEITGINSSTVIQHYESKVSIKYNKTEITKGTIDENRENPENVVAEGEGATYEKGDTVQNAGYSINKMSESDRARIVEQMKADAAQRKEQLINLVQKTLSGQISAFGKATGDNIWQMLSGGNFTVDAATKAQAQKDISEDGYWGVKQTSQRLFDFASALAGDDVDQMKKMQEAMGKGFKLATGAWGKDLPSICQQTMDAANRLFEEYYKSKENEESSLQTEDTEKVQ